MAYWTLEGRGMCVPETGHTPFPLVTRSSRNAAQAPGIWNEESSIEMCIVSGRVPISPLGLWYRHAGHSLSAIHRTDGISSTNPFTMCTLTHVIRHSLEKTKKGIDNNHDKKIGAKESKVIVHGLH